MRLRPFELVMVTTFGVLGVLAITLLAFYRPTSETVSAVQGQVEIWGTVPSEAVYAHLRPLMDNDGSYRNITYTQVDIRSFDDELVNALAEGRGPDAIFIPHEKLVEHRSKIQPLSYDEFPLVDFRSRYVDGAEIFAFSDGIYALPVMVDPIVTYWNRDILTNKGFQESPKTWEAVVNQLLPAVIERGSDRSISRAGLAFGEFQNVTQAFPVISLLMIQGGSALVTEEQGMYEVKLNVSRSGSGSPLASAVNFYTNFSDPSDPLYTWNRAEPLDINAFSSGDLALYFGYGSEARMIERQNPNLSFSIAEVPQGGSATVRRTYGSFYGLALLRSSDNKNSTLWALQTLGNAAASRTMADALTMAPVYRSAIQSGSNDLYGRVVYTSAAVARGWLNPDYERTLETFRVMVEDVQANRQDPSSAAGDGALTIRNLY